MKAEIIAIGTEITTGSTLNTNSHFLANKLLDLGIETFYQTSVDDNYFRLEEVLKIAINRSNLIITTGGLGPTEDDFTKEILAKHLGLELELDSKMKKIIEKKLSHYQTIPKNNFKQAKKIKGSQFITNDVGTAPGTYIKTKKNTIILLPGPPREMKPMFNKYVVPLIQGDNFKIISKSINLTGLGESFIETNIKDLIHKYDDVEVATFGKVNDVEIKIIARGNNEKELSKKIETIIENIDYRFKDNIYSYNKESIEEVVYKLLLEKKLKISFAESCTGGLVTSKIVRLPGASKVLDRGLITYSNKSKTEELNVSKNTLKNYGAVSKETSIEMVEGLYKKTNSDIGVSITGIAGPQGDSKSKDVGLVFISIGNKKQITTKEYKLTGSRSDIQNKIAESVFFDLRKYILNNY